MSNFVGRNKAALCPLRRLSSLIKEAPEPAPSRTRSGLLPFESHYISICCDQPESACNLPLVLIHLTRSNVSSSAHWAGLHLYLRALRHPVLLRAVPGAWCAKPQAELALLALSGSCPLFALRLNLHTYLCFALGIKDFLSVYFSSSMATKITYSATYPSG